MTRLPARLARSSAVAALAGLLAWAPPAWADARVEARRHFREGMSLIRKGDFEAGIAELHEAYRILPHPAVLYNIGRAYYDAGDYGKAIDELERYLASDPADKDEVVRLVEDARVRLDGQARERLEATEEDAPAADAEGRAPESGVVDPELEQLREKLQETLDRIDARRGKAGDVDRPASPPAARPPDPAGTSAPTIAGRVAEAANAAAGEDPYTPIVITSARYGQDTLEAPNAVTILTGEELIAAGVTSIPDLLRRIPGVDVMAMSPADYNIGVRGFNDRLANKVLVLIDGRSVYTDLLGNTLWPLLPIALADVERVEVVRGPGAALYGANAFSGVINIITRSPGAGSDRPAISLWGGLPDQGGLSLRLAQRVGPTAYRASFGVERKRRWYREIEPDRPDYELVAPHPDDAVRVGRFDLRVDHRIDRETSVSLSGGAAGGQDEFVAIGILRDFFVNGYQSYLRGDLILPEGFTVRAFWNRANLKVDQWARPVGSISLASHPVIDVVDVEVSSYREVDFGVRQRLNLGASFRWKSSRWSWLGSDPEEHHAAVFAQDEALLTDDLRAIVSLRLDRHPLLAAIEDAAFTDRYAISPRAALVWRVADGHAIRATAGTAFRTPTFLESYLSISVPTSTDAVVVHAVGNLELLPERVVATEVGWRSEPDDSRYQLDAAVYFNQVSSLIQLSELGPSPMGEDRYDPGSGVWTAGRTTFVNLDQDHKAIGGEIAGKLFPADGLDLSASATYERITQGGKTDRSTPPLKLSVGAQYRASPRFTLAGDLHFVSRQTWGLRSFDDSGRVVIDDVDLPAYLWAGARVAYQVPDSGLELALAGQNLLSAFQPEITPATGATDEVATPRGTHREHPLGQPIPPSVFATMAYRIW